MSGQVTVLGAVQGYASMNLPIPPPAVAVGLFVAFGALDRVLLRRWRSRNGKYVGWKTRCSLAAGIFAIGMHFYVNAWFAFDDAGEHPNHNKETKILVTKGVFAQTRNPFYVGVLGICLALSMALEAPLLLVAVADLFFYLQLNVIPDEENFARDIFGARFDEYCENTPRWFF